jgi:dienelactone hydrolase
MTRSSSSAVSARLLAGTILALALPQQVIAQAKAPATAATGVAPGPYRVGFRAFVQYDYSRTYRHSYDAKGDTVTGERARPIQTSVWYPAVNRAGGRPMQYADYLAVSALEEGAVHLDSAQRRRMIVKFATDFEQKLPDFERLVAHATPAYAHAAPAPGRFPVIVYGPSFDAPSWENAALCELLASHGYVVVASPALGVFGRQQTTTLESVDAEARDMEFLIGYAHTLPDADPARVGVMGYSWGGLADIIVALRNPGVRAVVALDGSIRYWNRLIQREPYGDARRMTAPFLFLAQATIAPDTAHKYRFAVTGRSFPFYDSLQFADAYYLTLEKMQHGNYGAWGNFMANAAERAKWSDTAAVRRSYELVETYVLHFLDAYLKKDSAGRAFLERPPEANGAPPGYAVMSSKMARPLPPDVYAFTHYVREHGGWSQATNLVATFLQRDSAYTLPEPDLRTLGDIALEDKRNADGIAVFKVGALLHPTSAEAMEALGEAYATANDTALAITTFKQSLALDSTQGNAAYWLSRMTNAK